MRSEPCAELLGLWSGHERSQARRSRPGPFPMVEREGGRPKCCSFSTGWRCEGLCGGLCRLVHTGLKEGDVGRHWLNNGFTVAGVLDKIVGFADCDVSNLHELKYAILLTGQYLGWDLPMCAETNPVWDLPQTAEDAKPVVGHATAAVGWDPDYLYIATWASLTPVTWPFVRKYLSEVHVTVSRRWINTKGTTPAGFDWDYLVAATRRFSTAVA
jgi:hypothetical protein